MMLAFSCMALRQPPRSALRPSRCAAHGLSRCASHSLMTAAAGRKRVVFLGTPACAARSLELLIAAANEGRSDFELIAVVSTPPVKQGRKMRLTNSPVQDMAEAAELPVLTPPNAKDETFLAALAELQPDLCITAAYGCFLPQRFLDMPKFGTLNIHPSLLPLYRGAAPLQRCLEAGDELGGVTVAFTVLKMDAGPVLRQQTRSMAGDEHFPELLTEVCCMLGLGLGLAHRGVLVRVRVRVSSPRCVLHVAGLAPRRGHACPVAATLAPPCTCTAWAPAHIPHTHCTRTAHALHHTHCTRAAMRAACTQRTPGTPRAPAP